MRPGTKLQYKDIAGVVTTPPRSSRGDTTKVWVLTQDGYLIGLPSNSSKLKVIESLPPLEGEDKTEAVKCGYISPTPKVTAKLFIKTGYIRLPETKRHPAGMFKIIAGGLGVTKKEVSQAIPSDCTCLLIDWNNGEGYFAIKLT